MSITIGSIVLTDENAPKVKMDNQFYRTENNIIIGGKKNITINGIVFYGEDGSFTASNVMKQLKTIRDLGKSQSCIIVNIPGYYTGNARISNVDIEQGSDPPWVNLGAFSISIEAPLDSIPPNSLGIVATDFVKSLSFSEKVDVGEDGHGFVYSKDNNLSKAYVRFNCKVSIEVDPICATTNIESILTRFIKNKPEHRLLSQYSGWTPYLQDRNYDVGGANSATFNTSSILLPPNRSSAEAYVTLDFKHTKNYSSKEETKTTSGNIRGLVSIPWTSIISIGSINSSPKLQSAEKALSYIISKFVDIKSWDGINYELFNYPNCPAENSDNSGGNCKQPTKDTQYAPCFLPSSSSIARARTEGSIDFTFEWTSDVCNRSRTSNTTSTEISVDDQRGKPTIVEHVIPTIGMLYQDLNCYSARRISFTSTISFPENSCISAFNPCATLAKQEADLQLYIITYLTNRGLNPADYLLITYNYNRTNRANTLTKGFISVCETPPITQICL